MVNASIEKYNVSAASDYQGLMNQVNGFVGGGAGLGMLLVAWLITFFSLQNYPNLDAGKAATWVTWLSAIFMSLIELVKPSLPLFLFLMVLTVVGYTVKPRQ